MDILILVGLLLIILKDKSIFTSTHKGFHHLHWIFMVILIFQIGNLQEIVGMMKSNPVSEDLNYIMTQYEISLVSKGQIVY